MSWYMDEEGFWQCPCGPLDEEAIESYKRRRQAAEAKKALELEVWKRLRAHLEIEIQDFDDLRHGRDPRSPRLGPIAQDPGPIPLWLPSGGNRPPSDSLGEERQRYRDGPVRI